MMMRPNDIAAGLKLLALIAPKEEAAGTSYSAAIDRTGFESCVVHEFLGAVAGAPDSFSVIGSLETSHTGSGDWVAYVPPSNPPAATPDAILPALTAASAQTRKGINLSNARQFIRYKRVTAFVSVTTPKVFAASSIVLGGARTLPVTY